MSAIVIDDYILPTLRRYIDQYHWSFAISTRIINLYYGTEYTQKELRRLYRRGKYPAPKQREGMGAALLTRSTAPQR